jgi:hypothetical protein
MAIKEEFIKAAEKLRRERPELFSGEYDGCPKFLPEELASLKAELRASDRFQIQCFAERCPM